MLLARTAASQKEIALRTALGARRGRLVRQFLTEKLLLSALGGGSGVLLALWGSDALVVLSPAILPRLVAVTIDFRVVLYLFGITLLTSVAFGLAPALQASTTNLSDTLERERTRRK